MLTMLTMLFRKPTQPRVERLSIFSSSSGQRQCLVCLTPTARAVLLETMAEIQRELMVKNQDCQHLARQSGCEDNRVIRMNKQRQADRESMAQLGKNQLQKSESYLMSRAPSTATTAYFAGRGRRPGSVCPGMDDEGEPFLTPPHRTCCGH